MKYEILVDMSVDIDEKTAKEMDIHYIPMEYGLGDRMILATEPESDEKMHDFYESMRNDVPTRTSQVTPYQYEENFLPFVKAEKGILYLALSSGLSKTFEAAQMAVQTIKEQYPGAQIEVIDSFAATGGIGLLAEFAARNRDAGMTLSENAAWLRENVHHINHWFMVEDLVYLKRGGRISPATAFVGTVLDIKPILNINASGELGSVANKRGSRQAMHYLAERYRERFDPEYGNTAYICCADCKDTASELKKMVLEINPEADVHITMLCPVIGAHTGPGMLSLIFYGKEME